MSLRQQGTIYMDSIPLTYEDGPSRGYELMAKNIAEAWNLQPKP